MYDFLLDLNNFDKVIPVYQLASIYPFIDFEEYLAVYSTVKMNSKKACHRYICLELNTKLQFQLLIAVEIPITEIL